MGYQHDPRPLDLWSSFLLETNRTHEVGFPKVEPSVMLVQFPSVQWVSRRSKLRSDQSPLRGLSVEPAVLLAPIVGLNFTQRERRLYSWSALWV